MTDTPKLPPCPQHPHFREHADTIEVVIQWGNGCNMWCAWDLLYTWQQELYAALAEATWGDVAYGENPYPNGITYQAARNIATAWAAVRRAAREEQEDKT